MSRLSLSLRLIALLLAIGLTTVLPTVLPATAEDLPLQLTNGQGATRSIDQLLPQLAQAQVLYLGETHDGLRPTGGHRAADHLAQLRVIQALHQRNPTLVIGLEMFQRPYQSVLDDYVAQRITEAELRQKTEYDKRWGFDWELYAPILRYAQAEKIPLVALNTPQEVTRKVSRQGLASLNWADRRFIPPLSAIRTEPAAYRAMLAEIFASMHPSKTAKPDPERFERFFQAQVLWDETMADRIARSAPTAQVIVLAGQGHLIYGYGIPDRVARRQPGIQQTVILLSPDPELAAIDADGRPIGDYVLAP
jgi:uncharacterized iron-regulated protein